MKRPRRQLSSKGNFKSFLSLNYSSFRLTVQKAIELPNISKEISLKRRWVSYNEINFPETVTHKTFETNSSFHLKGRRKEKAPFQTFSSSINKTFILVGRLGTRLSFYEF